VARRTIDNNLAAGGDTSSETSIAWPGKDGSGGGIWTSGLLNLTNVTLVGNRATGGNGYWDGGGGSGLGGGVGVVQGSAWFLNVTLAQNEARGADGSENLIPGASLGDGIFNTNGTVDLAHSILADTLSGGNAWGEIVDAGYNICSDGTVAWTDVGSLANTDSAYGYPSTQRSRRTQRTAE
jgi:hypothetical protein